VTPLAKKGMASSIKTVIPGSSFLQPRAVSTLTGVVCEILPSKNPSVPKKYDFPLRTSML
jgi:hypothetical protein